LWSNGGSVLKGDTCMLEQPEALEALEFYVKLSDISYLESQRRLDDKFLAGELGFIISGDWVMRMMRDNPPKFQVGACLIPGPGKEGSRSASFLGGEFLTINAKSDKKEEALKFIEFLVSEGPDYEFNRAAGSVTPSNKKAAAEILKEANPLAMVFLQQLNYARPSPVNPKWVQIQTALEEAVQKAIYHKGKPAQILKMACDEIDQIINEEE
jgi:multiple sugar transport system substrate-binding protein